ncbi:16S rRNA (guanine(527)-N(7))-methyltransferase RsmG [Nisaea nitritireducens]|uniref:16S rRNA (guanine(527)-N(7))-methyltransferase RsmG n=1 Tax=Nisaea nitritireducens TaxID=568392 RepID=UPI001868673A|nr:16S rRNA (guanine(527)-N(7))-methyltransferase RsmG [Nisaea nitritireducens]
MNPEEFAARAGVSRETLERLKIYAAMVERYQRAINLVSKNTLSDIWRRHFLDSAQVFPELPENHNRVLDLGSGAGFPGMVLAIMGARDVHLCESDQRKSVFLREVARACGAQATVHSCRIEELEPLDVDVVTARALATVDVLLDYSKPHLKEDGRCLFLKGRAVQKELTTARERWNMAETLTPSWSDPEGCLLRLEGISYVRSNGAEG